MILAPISMFEMHEASIALNQQVVPRRSFSNDSSHETAVPPVVVAHEVADPDTLILQSSCQRAPFPDDCGDMSIAFDESIEHITQKNDLRGIRGVDAALEL